MEKIKELLGRLSSKVKRLIIAGVIGVAVVVGAIVIALSMKENPYEVMFTGVGSEEAKQIIGKLQEDGIDYQYTDGDILVPAEQVDTTKARLVSEGYPKSGFTYDVFRDNVNLMTTDSDRRTFKLYDLETRIGSTIKLLDGVKEAYVTIALGETSKYALSDETKQEASAQAVVVMQDGGSPTEEQARSIQLLISRSIPGMVIDNVSVFDGNGREVSITNEDEDIASGKIGEEITRTIEDQIAAKVMNVLAPIYGNGNVRVSVKGTVNMEKLIRETIVYNTPEKIDENDKAGLTSEESIFREYSGNGENAAGVAGSEVNADIPQYNTGGGDQENAYASSSLNRKYLLNQIKEQGQVNPGTLENLTVSVVINGNGFGSLTIDDIRDLSGNAAGIALEERAAKITAVAAPFYTIEVPQEPEEPVEETGGNILLVNRWILIGALAGLIILLLIVLLIIRARRRRRARLAEMEISQEDVPGLTAAASAEEKEILILEPEEDRGAELRHSVREFTEQNPEISAQLLKTWLNGGGNNGD